MAKRVDPLKAKQAKQKKLAIVLCVLLAGVVAFQGPKMLKMVKGPQATPSAAPATPTPTPSGTADPAAPASPTAVPTQEAVLADSDVAPDAESGQLLSIESFATKDPFKQQLTEAVPSETPAPADDDAPDDAAAAESPDGASDVPPGTFDPLGSNPQDQDPNAPPVSTTPSEEAPATATETTISINGTTESVAPKAEFPAADPVFVLESLAADGKSVLISVAGGSYTDGKQTVKLQIGKRLTLQNTSDGSRYDLELLTVAGFVPPKK